MTVSELIAALSDHDPSMVVCVEGVLDAYRGIFPVADELTPAPGYIPAGGESYDTIILKPSRWP